MDMGGGRSAVCENMSSVSQENMEEVLQIQVENRVDRDVGERRGENNSARTHGFIDLRHLMEGKRRTFSRFQISLRRKKAHAF